MMMAGSLEGLAYLNGCPLTINSQTLSALERLLHIIARVSVIQRPACGIVVIMGYESQISFTLDTICPWSARLLCLNSTHLT
jgi:hypothetical protein